MKGVPYYEAGKGDTPRSCNSKKYLENYDRIFGKRKRLPKLSNKMQSASMPNLPKKSK